jgi:hypothetical protein
MCGERAAQPEDDVCVVCEAHTATVIEMWLEMIFT